MSRFLDSDNDDDETGASSLSSFSTLVQLVSPGDAKFHTKHLYSNDLVDDKRTKIKLPEFPSENDLKTNNKYEASKFLGSDDDDGDSSTPSNEKIKFKVTVRSIIGRQQQDLRVDGVEVDDDDESTSSDEENDGIAEDFLAPSADDLKGVRSRDIDFTPTMRRRAQTEGSILSAIPFEFHGRIMLYKALCEIPGLRFTLATVEVLSPGLFHLFERCIYRYCS
jgi:hypothetical protein